VIVLVIHGRLDYDNCQLFLMDKGKRIKDETEKPVSPLNIAGSLATWPMAGKGILKV